MVYLPTVLTYTYTAQYLPAEAVYSWTAKLAYPPAHWLPFPPTLGPRLFSLVLPPPSSLLLPFLRILPLFLLRRQYRRPFSAIRLFFFFHFFPSTFLFNSL